jgi:fibronectin-binding autotransporter adhesin
MASQLNSKLRSGNATYRFDQTRQTRLRSSCSVAVLALALVALAAPAAAQIVTWTGGTSADWTDGSNWAGGVVPTPPATAIINNSTLGPIVLGVTGAATASTGNLQIGSGAGVAPNITIQNGSTLTSSSGSIAHGGGGVATVTVTGPGSRWIVTTSSIAVGNNRTGALNIQDGGIVTARAAVSMAGGGGSTGTLNITTGGILETTGFFGGFGTNRQVNVDNGTLRALSDNTAWIPAIFTGTQLNIASGGLVLDSNGFAVTVLSGFTGAGSLTKTGAGTVTLATVQGYLGETVIQAGTLALANTGSLAASSRVVADGTFTIAGIAGASTSIRSLAGSGTVSLGSKMLTLTNANDLFSGTIEGTGGLAIGGGTQTLTGSNTYTGTTSITGASTLQIGNGGTSGSIVGDVTNDGTLAFNRSDVATFGGAIAGSGEVRQIGPGTTILTANNSYGGLTRVSAGTLLVNGDQSLATGQTTVAPGATLGGTGVIGGPVLVGLGGTLAPGGATSVPGELKILGSLAMSAGASLKYDLGQANVPGGAYNDLITVSGNVVLNNNTLDVTAAPGGSFDPGLYRVMNYGGSRSGTLAVGTVPTPDFFLQTSVAGQINLINRAGLTLNFWDGGANPRNDGIIGGGSGVWQAAGNDNWTNEAGAANATYAPGSFAMFMGAPGGVVTVDNSLGPVTASGMQFVSDNYVVQGGDITLTGPQAIIRVGDGTSSAGSNDARIDANLTGSAQLVKSDLGTLILSGTNSYTGGTTIAAGSLVLGNGGTSGSIQGDVVNNGNLGFNRSDAMTFAGTISGSGVLLQLNTGTTTLTGANTYSGGTVIVRGTLIGQATSFGSGQIVIFNPAALVIDQPSDASLANAIDGPGSFAKRGAGNLNLTGTSTFTGQTRVEAGKLSVNGSLANSTVTVASGATLGGSGSVGTTTIQSGATIAPGNSIGTLTVNGDLVLAPGSLFEVEIAGNGTSDRIAVSGIATVTGSQVGVSALDPQTSYINGQRYTILTAAGGVSGTVAGAVSRSAFLDLTVDHRPNQVDLVIALKGTPPMTPPGPGTPPVNPPAIFGSVAQTRNQFATAAGLDTLPQAGATLALYNSLLMLDAPSARQAFDALSGEIHPSAKSALVDESWLLRAAVNDRLRSAFGAVGASPMATLNYGFSADLAPSATGPMPRLRSDRFAVWGQGYGSWGRSDADRNAAKLTRSTGGFLIGADVAVVDSMRLGVVAGYSRSEFDVNGRLSSGESDNYHLGLYGGGQWGALGLRLGASYTWHDLSTRRTVAFAGFGNQLRSGYDAGTAQVFGEVGYRVELGKLALEPFAGLAYVNLHTDGLSETGGAAALSARSDDTSLGYSTLGLRASTTLALQGMDLTLRGGLAWRHAFGDVTPTAALAFAGSSSFIVAGLPIARDAAIVEAGLDLAISKSATLGVSYTGQLAQDTQDHAFKANLAVRF